MRSAYADHEPELVNGKRIPGEVSMSKQEYLFRGSAGAATQSDSVPDDLKKATDGIFPKSAVLEASESRFTCTHQQA